MSLMGHECCLQLVRGLSSSSRAMLEQRDATEPCCPAERLRPMQNSLMARMAMLAISLNWWDCLMVVGMLECLANWPNLEHSMMLLVLVQANQGMVDME